MTSPTQIAATCQTCRFWRLERPKSVPDGYCYRYPQTYRKHGEDDWCGEHQPKEEQTDGE